MKRIAIFIYGVLCYAAFFATFLYAIGFVANVVVPTRIDGPVEGSFAAALVIDLLLLAVFALQHSVMARPAFKRWWTEIVPPAAERSTYVLFSSVALAVLFWQWRPLGGVIWHVEGLPAALLVALCGVGWGTVLVTTFLINHFDLFGLRQVWLELLGRPYTPLVFGTPGPYKHVRHPLYVGWLLAFWATPTMTVAHLVFAVMTTAYILVAIRYEERDLVAAHPEYADYQQRVPMLVPNLRASDSEPARVASAGRAA